MSNKICLVQKIFGQKFFWSKKLFGPKKIWSKNFFGQKVIFGPNNIFGPKKFLVQRQFKWILVFSLRLKPS